jgi:HlyD family secretion protein
MNLRLRLAAGALAGAAIVGAAWWVFFRPPSHKGDSITLYGNIDIREIQAAFNDSDVVARMLVQEGDRLKKGELIATIDDQRYAARLDQARRQADSLKAALDRLVHGSRPEEIAQAKATMEALRAVYENNKTIYDRTMRLLPRGAASTEDRDNALAQLNSSQKNYEAAAQAYTLAVKGPREEDIIAARNNYHAAEAAAALAEREFADTRLYAPSDGIVEARILEPGDMASPSAPVYTIALTNPLWVRAYVPETELGKVKLGMRASVSTDSFPGRAYRGWIGYLSPTAEFTPKTIESPELRTRLVYQLRVYVCDPGGDLRLGMPATVRIDLSQPEPAGKLDASSPCGADDAPGK